MDDMFSFLDWCSRNAARVKKKGNRDIEKEEREEEKEEETIDFCAMARRERDRESRINDEQQ